MTGHHPPADHDLVVPASPQSPNVGLQAAATVVDEASSLLALRPGGTRAASPLAIGRLTGPACCLMRVPPRRDAALDVAVVVIGQGGSPSAASG